MNSVLQVLFTMPEFQEEYFAQADVILQTAPADPTDNFTVQMFECRSIISFADYLVNNSLGLKKPLFVTIVVVSVVSLSIYAYIRAKLAFGLLSGNYSHPPEVSYYE